MLNELMNIIKEFATQLSRMAYNDFINNIEYLMKHNFYICY